MSGGLSISAAVAIGRRGKYDPLAVRRPDGLGIFAPIGS